MICWDAILIGMNTVVSAVVLWSSICAVNRMTPHSPHLIRLAFVLMGVGAAATLLTPAYLYRVPDVSEVLLMTGVATLVISNKRQRAKHLFMRSFS